MPMSRAEFHLVSERLKAHIDKLIANNIGRNAVNFTNDGSLASRFTRAVSLYWLFVVPYRNNTRLEFPTSSKSSSYYFQIMNLEKEIVSQADDHYASLMAIGANYFTAVQPIRQLQDSLRRVAEETSNFVCHLIARYILMHEKTATQRWKRLSSIGFDAYDRVPVIGINQLVATVVGIATITLIAMTVTPRPTPLGTGEAGLLVAVFAIQIGISIVAGVFVADRFLQRDDGIGMESFPVAELAFACVIVAMSSAMLRIGSRSSPKIAGYFRRGGIL
jgi:hypothetical protein